ncbi:MAG TPA: translocation/assembly module TamB domain-containing protein [Burkholderiales bacterium]
MKWLLRACVALLLLLVAAAGWLLGTESGLRWALGFAPPELVVEGPRGALAREIGAERVAWDGIVDARQVSFQINLLALLTDTVSINFLRIDSLTVKRPEDHKDEDEGFLLPIRIKVSDAQAKSVVFEGYEAHDVRVDYTGSALGHEIAAALRAAGARAKLKASLDSRARPSALEADVEALNLAVIDPDFPETALRARLEARGDEKAARGTISVENPHAGPLDRDRLPLARARAAWSTDYSSITLQGLAASLHGSGVLEGNGLVSQDKTHLELKVREVDLRGLVSSLASTRLAGQLAIALEPKRQRVGGSLSQDDMSLAADVERNGDTLEVRALRARAAGGEASGRARIRVDRKAFEADLKLARFDPSRFGDYPKGDLNGSVKGNGSLGASRAGAFTWDIADSTLLEQPFASSGRARLAGERIADADAWATLGGNRATAKGSFGGPRDGFSWSLEIPELNSIEKTVHGQVRAHGTARGTYARPSIAGVVEARKLAVPGIAFDAATLKAEGTLDAHEGDLKARNRDLDLSAKLKGGWSRGAWRGEIVSFENAGERALVLQAPAPLEVGPGRVALGRFNATLVGGRLALESVRWEEGRLSSTGAFAALPAQSVLNFLGEKRVAGNLTLDGDWSILATPKLNGRLALRRAGGDLTLAGPPQVPLELSRATLDARFTDDRVAAALDIATRLATLRAEGEAAGLTPDAAANWTAQVDLQELRLLTEPLLTQVRIAGRIGARLKGGGTLGKPLLSGTLSGDALGIEAPPWGVALSGGRLRAELEGDRLRIVEAAIAGGDGRFSVRGALPLRVAEGGTALQWEAERFRVLNRPDMRLVVSGSGAATFDGKKFGLKGALRADSGHFEALGGGLPVLDDDIVIAGREPVARAKRGPLPIDLDLQLDLGQQLTLRGFGYTGGVAGNLRVWTDTAGELLAQGRLRAVRARFRAYGQELDVDPGVLTFDGPLARPGLDITAWRRHQAVEAGVRVTGTIEAPRVELISNPPVADADKLSWLVLGRAPSTASGADLAILQAASGALLAGDQEPLQRRIAQRLGLDEITVRSSSDLSSQNVFALGKRLSDKLYVSFEQGLGATVEYLVKLDYSLTNRVSLRGQTGTSSGVGVFYRWAWD